MTPRNATTSSLPIPRAFVSSIATQVADNRPSQGEGTDVRHPVSIMETIGVIRLHRFNVWREQRREAGETRDNASLFHTFRIEYE